MAQWKYVILSLVRAHTHQCWLFNFSVQTKTTTTTMANDIVVAVVFLHKTHQAKDSQRSAWKNSHSLVRAESAFSPRLHSLARAHKIVEHQHTTITNTNQLCSTASGDQQKMAKDIFVETTFLFFLILFNFFYWIFVLFVVLLVFFK